MNQLRAHAIKKIKIVHFPSVSSRQPSADLSGNEIDMKIVFNQVVETRMDDQLTQRLKWEVSSTPARPVDAAIFFYNSFDDAKPSVLLYLDGVRVSLEKPFLEWLRSKCSTNTAMGQSIGNSFAISPEGGIGFPRR